MSVIVNESGEIVQVVVKEIYGKDGQPGADGQDYQVDDFADFTGELDVSGDFQPYNDYTGAEITSLTLSTAKKRGATGNVRVKGGSIATNALTNLGTVLPAGATISTDVNQWNEIDYQYLSDTHIRIILTVLDSNFQPIATSQPAGDTTAPTISSATIEDAAPTNLVVVFSEVVTITDLTGLSISGTSAPAINSVSGSGTNTLTFVLASAAQNGDSWTFEVSGTNNIIDGASNPLAATSQAITNNVASASEYMYHKLDVATTNADPVTVSTDTWTTTPYPLENVGTVNRSVQNTLECVRMTQGNWLRTTNTVLTPLFQNSFNVQIDVKLDDGNPSETQYLWGIYNTVSNRVYLDIRTDGKVTFVYSANGNTVYAQTNAGIFADGAMADFARLRVEVTEGGNAIIKKDGVVQTLNASFNGDMTTVVMNDIALASAKFYVGTGTGNGTYVSAPGYYKEFKIEQV